MKKSARITSLALALSLTVGIVFSGGMASTDDPANSGAADVMFTQQEELELKQRLHAEAVFSRVFRKEALTAEDSAAYEYLRRPVVPSSEAAPEDITHEIAVHFEPGLSRTVQEAVLAKHGLILGERIHTDAFALRATGDKQERADLVRRLQADSLIHTAYGNVLLRSDPLAKIAKNLVALEFNRKMTDEDLAEFQRVHGLVIVDQTVISPNKEVRPRYVFFILDGRSVGAVVKELHELPVILYVEPEVIKSFRAVPPRTLPTDPSFNLQWHYHQDRKRSGTNSNADDSRDFDTDGPEAWSIYTGGAQVIAILDYGFRATHNDLATRLWTKPGSAPAEHGWDFVTGSAIGGAYSAGDAHGTQVTGMASAATNNALIAAGNWSNQIMLLRFNGDATQEIDALQYAIANNAHVVNMSFAGAEGIREAAQLAATKAAGLVLVAAGGNDHEDPGTAAWPADSRDVIEVAGTNDENKRFYIGAIKGSAWGSGGGPAAPQLCAPAQDLLTLHNTSNTALIDGMYGTSFAAPQVAAAAALIVGKYGGGPDQVERILKAGVTDVEGDVNVAASSSSRFQQGPDDLGKGRLNLFKILAPPRVAKLHIDQDGGKDTLFIDGDLNGNNRFNCCDPDLDGDDYRDRYGASVDDNDDGDRFLDGTDTDDDGDGIPDGASNARDTRAHSYKTPKQGETRFVIQFNESMLMDNFGGGGGADAVDPTVTLILNDTSKIVLPKTAGNGDWKMYPSAVGISVSDSVNYPGAALERDAWIGKVTLTKEQAKKCACMKIEIKDTRDIAGETLSHDVAATKPYVYVLRANGGLTPEDSCFDFGDALDYPLELRYPTLLKHDGARHDTISFEWLGPNVCIEKDANDWDDPDGERNLEHEDTDHWDDGIIMPEAFEPGTEAEITVKFSTCGMGDQRYNSTDRRLWINGWIDWDADYYWENDTTEHVLHAWTNPSHWGVDTTRDTTFTIKVPEREDIKASKEYYARFRLSFKEDANSPTGKALYGEVEDYHLTGPDYGDAPDSPYPTCKKNDGALHRSAGLHEWLGRLELVDAGVCLDAPMVTIEYDASDDNDEDGIPNLGPEHCCDAGGQCIDCDHDKADDGIDVGNRTFTECVIETLHIAISTKGERTKRYAFTNDADSLLYVNLFVDWNVDGDWKDATVCNQLGVCRDTLFGFRFLWFRFEMLTGLWDCSSGREFSA